MTNSFKSNIRHTLLQFGEGIDTRELFPVMDPEAADLVPSDPYAFSLATCLDRQTKAEIIWTIPFWIKKDLEHLDPYRINELSMEELHSLFQRLPNKPRFVNAAPNTVRDLTAMVIFGFDGDASGMWQGRKAVDVKRTFRSIRGVAEQISNMALLLIEKAYGKTFADSDRMHMDIKADVHTRRVLFRLGMSEGKSENQAIAAARSLYPIFPGQLDAPLWVIGRKWCQKYNPKCGNCPMDHLCDKVDV